MQLRRQPQSRKRRLFNAAATYLKFKAIAKSVKAATKVAKQAPTPVKALPVVAGVGAAGAVVARKRRHEEEPTPV